MMEKYLSRSIRVICLGGMTLGMTAAFAQDAAQPLQRVEVTGSRIRQVDLETAQPIQVMTSEQIQKTGLITVGDVLNQLSSAGSPDFSKGGSLTSNRENGGQYINLRNLGSNRLLVLVDGKRWTQSVDGYTDMSTVPSSMIERIEVLKDGASSIYGSDAIAGVVNIILKKRLEGGNLSVYLGQNEKADGKSKDFSLSFGANGEKTSLMFGLSHTEQGVVWAKTRPVTGFPRGPKYPNEGLGVGPWGEILPLDFSFDKVLNHTGGPLGDGTGQDSRNPANYHDWDGGPLDNFNSASQMMFAMPTKLDTIFTKGTVELPYGMRFQTTAMYSQRKSVAQVAGYPLNSESQPAFPVYIDKDSYYNPFGNQVAGAGQGQDLYFYRRTIEVPRVTENTNRTLHIDATLSGDFELRSLPWNWSVGYNHSKVDGDTMATGNINLINLKKALGPSFRNASGAIQCGTAAAPIALAECTPFDILGGPSASTPAALNYIMSIGGYNYGSKVDSATADLSGELFQLPAGALGAAAGIEHRTVEGRDLPGEFQRSGFSTDLAGNPTTGRYTVREAYAELNIPILKGLPFVEQFSANLATRYSDYSNFGSTNNSKASLTYRPIKDLLFRGTWAEGFRAPTVGDSFGGGQQSFDSYLDPCDTVYGDAARNTSVLGRCNSGIGGIRGTPAAFRQKTQTGANITSSSSVQSSVPFNVGAGNAFLQPETAVTRTLGAVFNPGFLPGFSAAVDWYSIQIDNRILSVSSNTILDECYNKGQTNFCGLVSRDATGMINDIRRGNVNFGQIKTEGVDVELRYRMPRFSWGQINLRSETTYLDEYSTKSGGTAQWIDYSGDYDFHRWKSNLTADWSLGNLSATWGVRYLSSVTDQCLSIPNRWQCNDLTTTRPGATSPGANRLASLVFHDISVGYKLPWNANVRAGVNNAFDKKPRFTVLGAASSTYVDADLPIDRFFYVRYNQNF
eukprot:TRINITY_DN9481_c0_g1_i1.p2 TRINITY_DN9481_c0_g1~~TRINITY_DN9481_c0_g1_i1.p2  ORF type:complete len:963 (+),score=218.51 TRINITY_DN9481_c0_g1_i1:101-2989(+)